MPPASEGAEAAVLVEINKKSPSLHRTWGRGASCPSSPASCLPFVVPSPSLFRLSSSPVPSVVVAPRSVSRLVSLSPRLSLSSLSSPAPYRRPPVPYVVVPVPGLVLTPPIHPASSCSQRRWRVLLGHVCGPAPCTPRRHRRPHPCCSPFPPHEQLLVAAVRGAAMLVDVGIVCLQRISGDVAG